MTNERKAIRRIMISINKIDELYERVQRKAGVKELESDGYVRMETISGQRREMHIYLTEAGKKMPDRYSILSIKRKKKHMVR